MSASPPPPVDPAIRILAAQVAGLQRRVRDMEQADQGGARSIDDGGLEVYDDDDNLRARVGRQPDGSYAVKAFSPKPAVPTEPDVIPVPGGCIVEWEGTFEEAQEDPVQRVAIHVGSTPDFEVNDDEDEESDTEATEKAAILSPRGGSAFLALDPGQETYYVRLTAVGEGGVESDPSGSVEVNIAGAEGAFWQDEFTLSVDGAQTKNLTYTPLPNSEHVYCNGLYQREDIAWTRIGQSLTLTDTPYPPKVGDRVTVEYAYLPGEDPDPVPLDGMAFRATDNGGSEVAGSWPVARGSDLTVMFLIQLRENPGGTRFLFNKGNNLKWNSAMWMTVSPARVLRLVLNGNVSPETGSSSSEAFADVGSLDSDAHMVVVRYNATTRTATVRIDGTETGSVTLPPTVQMVANNAWNFGSDYISWDGGSAPADWDEVAWWNRLLTDEEVTGIRRAWRLGGLPDAIRAATPFGYLRLDSLNGGSALSSEGVSSAQFTHKSFTLVPALQTEEVE